jgi:hypothetical protein
LTARCPHPARGPFCFSPRPAGWDLSQSVGFAFWPLAQMALLLVFVTALVAMLLFALMLRRWRRGGSCRR